MNVLSLFDGISCGQLAINRAGIDVKNYYASEIDSDAINVTQYNHKDTIQIGDVKRINTFNVPTIDLLLGGSPCQGFSFAGKQLNFNDDRSKLFFEYVRILELTAPKFWLLENVPMKKEFRDVISSNLGVEPILINSALLSKQNRKRLYWTNIPIAPIKPINSNFNQWLYRIGHGYIKDEIKFFEKYPCVTAQHPSTKYRVINNFDIHNPISVAEIKANKLLTRFVTPEECEEFQTLPIGYTNILKSTKRYKAIGNGWTVDVVAHILKGII